MKTLYRAVPFFLAGFLLFVTVAVLANYEAVPIGPPLGVKCTQSADGWMECYRVEVEIGSATAPAGGFEAR